MTAHADVAVARDGAGEFRIEPLPPTHGYPTAWWGTVVLIATEAMVFIALLSAYFFVRASSPRWPPAGIELPELHRSVLFTVILLGSSIPIFWMEHALVRGRMTQVRSRSPWRS
jgi:heme/copper-type cytochrome/quinol oxidase subunit 3